MGTYHQPNRQASKLPCLLFCFWLLVQLALFVGLARQDQSPIDFLTYRRAADMVARGASPYLTPEQAEQIWESFHQTEADFIAARAVGQGQAIVRQVLAGRQQAGPYLYPPTLALLIAQFHITALVFAGLTLLSILGFGWLWLKSTGAHSLWLLLIMFSWDLLASLYTGNVELILLFAILLAARLLWNQHAMFASPLIALVLLIKPFYVLFFIVFGLLQLTSHPGDVKDTLRALAVSASGVLTIMALDVVRWGAQLQAETARYLFHALDYQWFVLPVAEQTPLSIWNRSSMQALVNAGVAVGSAQWIAFGLWLLFAAITCWRARGQRLSFATAFALSFVLLYWGRPVAWTLIYLELVVVAAAWSNLSIWWKRMLTVAVISLMVSHWWALALGAGGYASQLLTLQSAAFPWETWSIVPLGWFLLLKTMSLTGTSSHVRMSSACDATGTFV